MRPSFVSFFLLSLPLRASVLKLCFVSCLSIVFFLFLTYHPPAERLYTYKQKRHKGDTQSQDHPAHRQRRDSMPLNRWHHSETQSFRSICQRIEQRNYLKPPDRVKRPPRIIGTTRENQRREDQREHQANLLWLDQCTDSETQAGAREGRQNHNAYDRANSITTYTISIAEYPVSQRKDDRSRDQPAHCREDDLLHRDQAHWQRSQQTVIYFTRKAKVEYKRQSNALQRGRHHSERDDSW